MIARAPDSGMKPPISITEDDLRIAADTPRPLIAMVSGGCDSTALAYALADLVDEGMAEVSQVLVFHVDHQLRGADSRADARFVRELAARLGFASKVVSVDVTGMHEKQGGSLEAVARDLRYEAADDALDEWCSVHGVPCEEGRMLTAHTLDDRVETFFMRTIVGTGPGGLASIPARHGRIVRPLLDATRAELEAYVRDASTRLRGMKDAASVKAENSAGNKLGRAACAQPVDGRCDNGGELWREDASNECDDFFRNFVRHRIVPVAREANPDLAQTMRRMMDLIADEDTMLEEQASSLIERAVGYPARGSDAMSRTTPHTCSDVWATIDPCVLGQAPKPLQRRVLHTVLAELLPEGERIETCHIEAVIAHGAQPTFAIDLPGAIRVRNEYGILVVYPLAATAPAANPAAAAPAAAPAPGAVAAPAAAPGAAPATLAHERVTVPAGEDPVAHVRARATATCIYVDEEKLLEACGGDLDALEVRAIEPGDAICPLGMGGARKKVSDILVDRKVPVRVRQQVRMLWARETPVWLIGIVCDERFRIEENPQVICLRTEDNARP